MIRASIVARYKAYLFPISEDTVRRMCARGEFKTAVKLGPAKNSAWYVSPVEVLSYKMKRHATVMNND